RGQEVLGSRLNSTEETGQAIPFTGLAVVFEGISLLAGVIISASLSINKECGQHISLGIKGGSVKVNLSVSLVVVIIDVRTLAIRHNHARGESFRLNSVTLCTHPHTESFHRWERNASCTESAAAFAAFKVWLVLSISTNICGSSSSETLRLLTILPHVPNNKYS